MTRSSALLLPLALVVACSGASPMVSSSSTGSGGGTSSTASSGSGGASSTSTGSGGAGGSVTSGTGGTGAGSTSGAGGDFHGTGGTSGCSGTYIDVTGDGPSQHFTALCENTFVLGSPTGPVAYHPTSGGFIESLIVVGCATSATGSPQLSLNVSAPSVPGTDTKATATYVDGSQASWQSTAAGAVSVTVDVYEDVGGVVEGSYTADVSSGSSSKMLSGTFRVCHEWDIPKP